MLTKTLATKKHLVSRSGAAMGIPRVLVVLWLALWVLALPLFHIHTQIETQRGIPHSVFSADLPGEYAPPSIDPVTVEGKDQQSGKAARLASGSSYPELAFTSPVPAKDKYLQHYRSSDAVQGHHQQDLIASPFSISASVRSLRHMPVHLFSRTSRAPTRT